MVIMRLLIIFSSILATMVVVGSCEVHENAIEVHENLQAPSMAPSKDCSVVIYDMADCVPYLSDDSKQTKPDHSCCSGFETVIETNADCICEALKKSGQMGIQLNLTRAMALPSACGVSPSPLNSCHRESLLYINFNFYMFFVIFTFTLKNLWLIIWFSFSFFSNSPPCASSFTPRYVYSAIINLLNFFGLLIIHFNEKILIIMW